MGENEGGNDTYNQDEFDDEPQDPGYNLEMILQVVAHPYVLFTLNHLPIRYLPMKSYSRFLTIALCISYVY